MQDWIVVIKSELFCQLFRNQSWPPSSFCSSSSSEEILLTIFLATCFCFFGIGHHSSSDELSTFRFFGFFLGIESSESELRLSWTFSFSDSDPFPEPDAFPFSDPEPFSLSDPEADSDPLSDNFGSEPQILLQLYRGWCLNGPLFSI